MELAKIKSQIKTYERYYPAAFFVLGVLIDIFTTGRIDDWFSIATQLVYLLVCSTLLLHIFLVPNPPEPGSQTLSKIKSFYFNYRTEALHFAFGSLLSVYTIFYFKSSSIMVSGSFLFFIVALLFANEFSRFQSLGLEIKFSLLTLCWISFFSYFVPTILGTSNIWVFVISLATGVLPVFFMSRMAEKKLQDKKLINWTVRLPATAVVLVFLGLYFLKLIPPVPLSAQYMGLFHKVEKNSTGQFMLSHERSWWKFWHNGDQDFKAAPGDKIHLFFRLFSPTNFKDQIFVTWYIEEVNGTWSLQDRIPIPIYGGREEGFRGYAIKSNYRPGSWKATLETEDQREISRIYFEVEPITSREEPFHIQLD